jgi:acyl-CoA thioester hydrolase
MAEDKSNDQYPKVWHETRLRVPLFEIDLGQAVYHGNYYHLFELGREDFLRSLGYPYRQFMDQQLHLAIVEASCSYRRPVRYDDLIEVHTGVNWWRSRSLALSHMIYRHEGEAELKLCTKATLNMVCVRFSGQPAILPIDFVDLLKGWEK